MAGSASIRRVPVLRAGDSVASLWTELDAGAGAWDNIPGSVRQGFRLLLDALETERGMRRGLETQMKELSTQCSLELEASRKALLDVESKQRRSVADLRECRESTAQLLRLVCDAFCTPIDAWDVFAGVISRIYRILATLSGWLRARAV